MRITTGRLMAAPAIFVAIVLIAVGLYGASLKEPAARAGESPPTTATDRAELLPPLVQERAPDGTVRTLVWDEATQSFQPKVEGVLAVGVPGTTTTSPPPPPPPSHCEDYAAMERGEGHPDNQHWFNHLDHRGYARVHIACVYRWGTAEWNCLEQLWDEESGWKPTADGHGDTWGIPQASPGGKMAAAGSDWRWNGRTQVRWGAKYIADRYGRPTRASLKGTPCHAGY